MDEYYCHRSCTLPCGGLWNVCVCVYVCMYVCLFERMHACVVASEASVETVHSSLFMYVASLKLIQHETQNVYESMLVYTVHKGAYQLRFWLL
jgi:hypothetical protein